MLSRRSHSRVLAIVLFGLSLISPDLLYAQTDGSPGSPPLLDIQLRPLDYPQPLVSIKSGAEGQKVEISELQSFTVEFDKPIQSVSGYDHTLLQGTPATANKVQFNARGKRGETTLVIKGEGDTEAKVAVTIKSGRITELQKTLQKVCPDAELQLMEIHDSILLRGKIASHRDLALITDVASQYYPTVLNHIVVNADRAPVQPVPVPVQSVDPRTGEPTPQKADKRDLQSDIRALHADVKRLIELLEQRQSSTDRKGEPQAREDQARRKRNEYGSPRPSPIVDPDDRPDAAARPGTFSGVVRVTGEVPSLPPAANAEHQRNSTDEPIPDDSLIVGDNNGLANVFVYLREPPPGTEADDSAIDEPVKLMSRKGRFLPHCAIVRVGQDVQLQNFDPVLTNFHTSPLRNPAINMALPPNDHSGTTFAYERPELLPIKIGDDVHFWKRAYHLVVDHPYAAVTDEQGRFQIEGLPPGEYEFCIWHERAGHIDKDFHVTIGDDRWKDIEVVVDVAQLLAQQPATTKADAPRVAHPKAVPALIKSPTAVRKPPEVARMSHARVLLYFYADWAEPSPSFRPVVRHYAQLEAVPVSEIDVDKHRSTAMYFRVTELPTLMLIENQKEVARTVNWENRNELQLFLSQTNQPKYDRVWNALGLRLLPLPQHAVEFAKHKGHYAGGMLISELREDFPHPQEDGVRKGDVIVGLGLVPTTNIENVIRALQYNHKADESGASSIRFYAVRDGVAFDGELRIATTKESEEPPAEDQDDKLGCADGARDDAEPLFFQAAWGTELLFFSANWCVPCQQMAPVMREVEKEGLVRVRIVDVDKDRALAEKYGIKSIPTLVLVCNGEEVHRKVGIVSADEVRELLRTARNGVFTFHVGFTR